MNAIILIDGMTDGIATCIMFQSNIPIEQSL